METEMSEKPILFSTPMVKSILEGRKTQTKHVMQPQPEHQAGNDPKKPMPIAVWVDNTKWMKSPYQPWENNPWGFVYEFKMINQGEER